jgi:acyl-CoA hydrolase
VAELVEDGATLQMGIGAIPNAVLTMLGNHKDLGVHSEMFADGILPLVEKGVVNGKNKKIDKGKMVATFLMGSKNCMILYTTTRGSHAGCKIYQPCGRNCQKP